MKKLNLILLGVLFCTQVFASGTVELKKTTNSSSAVVKAAGSKIVKVYYKSETREAVQVSIANSSGDIVFNETVLKTNGFIRPYNFGSLPEDTYTVTLRDSYGKMQEEVSNTEDRVQKVVNINKLKGSDKYLLTILSPVKENISIVISDSDNNILYKEIAPVEGAFGKVFCVKGGKNISIDVVDRSGILKSVKY